jgi:hypothetical protein
MQDVRLTDSAILTGIALEFLRLAKNEATTTALRKVIPDLSPDLLEGGSAWFAVVLEVLKATDPDTQYHAVRELISRRLLRPVLLAFSLEALAPAIMDALYGIYNELPRSETLVEHSSWVQEGISQRMTQYELLPLGARGALILPLLLGADLIKDGGCN